MNNNQQIEIDLLLEAIFLKYGYDFRNYSRASITRRIHHKIAMSGLNSVSEIQHRLLYDPEFFEELLLDLSINVTEMFRDPSFFLSFRNKVIPHLQKLSHIKMWVAGCATGEEVYSLAILLQEEKLSSKILIYATDFNEQVLKIAKEGIYRSDQVTSFRDNYQNSGGVKQFSDYYTERYGYINMKSSLKKNIVFADHNLVTDHSFGEMNVILCRNVLIYFNRQLQNRVFKLFSESLAENGFLCLGKKETIRFSGLRNCCKKFDMDEKIYQINCQSLPDIDQK